MIEAMVRTDARSIKATLRRLGLSKMEHYFYYNANSLIKELGPDYIPCLLFLDKEGNITNTMYFESNEAVHDIIDTIKGTTSVK